MFLKLNRYSILLSVFCLLPYLGISQIYNTEVEAEIALSEQNGLVNITGSAYNKSGFSQSLRYVLSVIRTNPTNSNTSKNDQTGRVVLESGQKQNLSATTINVDPEYKITILLLVYNLEDKLLGMKRLVLNDPEGSENTNKVILESKNENISLNEDINSTGEDGVILRGILVEDTKTKPGRDFYKEFNSLYTYYNINGPKVVTIQEELSIANNTKLEIVIDNTVVVEFILRPQIDFIKQAAKESIEIVYNYFKNLNKKQIF